MHVRRSILGVLVASLGFVLAAAPGYGTPPDLTGEWSVQGKHSQKGAYSGKVTITENADHTATLVANLVVTATGEKLSWQAGGVVSDTKVTFKFVIAPGLVGGLSGSKAKTYKGSYTISADKNVLTGTWKTGTVLKQGGTETLTRAGAVPAGGKYLALVRPDGKEAKDECLAVHLEGRDDLLGLKVKKDAAAGAGATFALTYPAERVAVWKSKTKQAGTKVAPGATLPNEDATLWVEGLAASDAGAGETIGIKLTKGSTAVGEDRCTASVARSAFHLAGHGAGGAYQMESWLRTAGKDSRSNPTFVEGKDEKTQKKVFWAVWVMQDDKSAKLALGTKDAVISYDGHSNFGMGFAFETGFRSIAEFLNIADPQCPVNWQYLREHQEHPDLMISDKEYADDAATAEVSDPVGVAKTVKGKLSSYDTTRWPASGGNGSRHHLTRGKQKWLDHHYGDEDNYRIVVKAGSGDMPEKRWSRIYLHSCYSGQYYSDSFGGKGTLFFTHDEAHAYSTALPAFIRSVVEGKTDDQILKAINKEENLNDYAAFGN